ncbi:MAG: DUF1043 family protein [Pseudomonadota bacterium]
MEFTSAHLFISFLIGLASGFGIHWIISSSRQRASNLAKALDETQAEFSNYQDNVNSHFKRVSSLVQSIARQQAELEQEIQEGAASLSSRKKALSAAMHLTPPTPEPKRIESFLQHQTIPSLEKTTAPIANSESLSREPLTNNLK